MNKKNHAFLVACAAILLSSTNVLSAPYRAVNELNPGLVKIDKVDALGVDMGEFQGSGIMAGEKVSVKCFAKNPGTTLISTKWNIAGTFYKDYQHTSDVGKVTYHASEDLEQPRIGFYWTSGGSLPLTCSGSIYLTDQHKSVNFIKIVTCSVTRPSVLLHAIQLPVQGGDYLKITPHPTTVSNVISGGPLAEGGQGLTINAVPAASSKSYLNGDMGYLQLIFPGRKVYSEDNIDNKGAGWWKSPTPPDTTFRDGDPDGFLYCQSKTLDDNPSQGMYIPKWPTDDAYVGTKVAIDEAFYDQFMYKPNRKNAGWAPLASVTWHWAGNMSLNNGTLSKSGFSPNSNITFDGRQSYVLAEWNKYWDTRSATAIPWEKDN